MPDCFSMCLHILHSHQQWMKGFHILLSFLIQSHLVGVKWYLTVFLSCISLMINNECFSMCLLDILAYSLERCLLKAFAFNLVVFVLLNCMTSWFKFLIRYTTCIFFSPYKLSFPFLRVLLAEKFLFILKSCLKNALTQRGKSKVKKLWY